MIVSVGDGMTEAILNGGRPRRFPADVVRRAEQALAMLAAANELRDLRQPPGNRLEALSGDLAGYHSIRVNRQWRVVFRWTPAGAEDVRVTDYH